MKNARVPGTWMAIACVVVATHGAVLAQEKPGWTPVSKEQEAMAVAMNKAMTPGEPHKLLASLSGEWTITTRFWMEPGAPPSEWTGTASYTMVMGGRYLQSTYRGNMLDMAFEGFGLTAYDNTTGQYQSVWMDNMSTTLMFMTGSYDAAARAFTMRTEMSDLVNPATKVPVRQVLTIIDADTHTMKMFETRGGKETLTLEIRYARKR